MHEPEVSRQLVLAEHVVGEVEDLQGGEGTEAAREAGKAVHALQQR